MNLEKEVFEIALADIVPNRFQPREKFDEQAINELALSIKEHGVIQPIIVRKINDKYEIVAGERRYRASLLAGKETIPALIRNIDDKESAKVALLENLQRKNLTAIEEARTYQTILKLDNLTQEELAQNLGKSQSAVANKIRLLNLTPEAQDALLHEKISERHARSLLNLPDKAMQNEMLNKVIMNRMTVKQLDDEIATLTGNPIIKEDDNMLKLEEVLPKKEDQEEIQDSISNSIKQEEISSIVKPMTTNIFDGLRREPKEISIIKEEEPLEEITPTSLELPKIDQEENSNFKLEETYVPSTEELKNAPVEDSFPVPKYAGPKYDSSSISVESPSYTELEALEEPNSPIIDNIYDNNSSNKSLDVNPINIINPIDTINNIIEPISPKEEPSIDNNIYDMRFAINNFRQAIQNTEKFGFNVESEEFDFDNVYQIVIKIDKKKDTINNY